VRAWRSIETLPPNQDVLLLAGHTCVTCVGRLYDLPVERNGRLFFEVGNWAIQVGHCRYRPGEHPFTHWARIPSPAAEIDNVASAPVDHPPPRPKTRPLRIVYAIWTNGIGFHALETLLSADQLRCAVM
jgi:hypothetical protein